METADEMNIGALYFIGDCGKNIIFADVLISTTYSIAIISIGYLFAFLVY